MWLWSVVVEVRVCYIRSAPQAIPPVTFHCRVPTADLVYPPAVPPLDVAAPASIVGFATALLSDTSTPLHILINNAGASMLSGPVIDDRGVNKVVQVGVRRLEGSEVGLRVAPTAHPNACITSISSGCRAVGAYLCRSVVYLHVCVPAIRGPVLGCGQKPRVHKRAATQQRPLEP